MRRHLSFALLFLLVPCLAFGATATSTGSGNWSAAIWSGGSGSGGAPADGDAVVIAEGHSVRADVDMSEWTGLTTLTITGSASGTPGMLYWADGNSSTLRFRTGSNYGILGTNVANKGRLLANSDGVWANNDVLDFATKAVIQLDGTSLITATYLDIKLLCTEPTNKYVEVYGTAYAMADQTSGVNASTDVLTFDSAPPADTTPVMLRSSGTMPGGLSTTAVYYVRDKSGNTCKLALISGGTAVDVTSTGSGALTMYDGHSNTGTKEMAIIQDLTADTAWITTAGHNRVVLADVNAPSAYDQQRDTIASIDTSAPFGITITTNNVDSAQYPLARIYLSSRNVSIRSSGTSTSQAIITESTGNTFGCEITNTYQPGTQTTFYSYALSSSNNNTISGTISGCNYALISSSNNNTISGTISGCNSALYSSSNNTISGTISGCNYALDSSSNNNTISGTISGCNYALYSSSNNTISGTISGCNHALYSSSNNNTISGTISGCNSALSSSSNNTISGTISGCIYALSSSSNNNTISGTISGCSYDIRGNNLGNIIIGGRTAGDLTYYSGSRNTQGVEMRLGVESWLYAIGTDFVLDAWGDVDRVTHGSPRTGGSAAVIRATAQSNIASYAMDGLLLFAHRIYIPISGERTITYYAQTDYTSGLTSDQVKLTCTYEDNETGTHTTSVTSTQGVTIRSGEDDWDQYLQVTVVPGHASFVNCEARLYAYESGKYLWVDPMLVTTGQTVVPSWQYGESKVNVYATPASGGGGKWVY